MRFDYICKLYPAGKVNMECTHLPVLSTLTKARQPTILFYFLAQEGSRSVLTRAWIWAVCVKLQSD